MFIAMSVSVNKTYSAADLKFLNLLSEKFPTLPTLRLKSSTWRLF